MGTILLLKVELRGAHAFGVDEDQVPAGTRTLLLGAAANLESLGFMRRGFVAHDQMQVLPDFEALEYLLLYTHAVDPAWAIVRLHEDGIPIEPLRITFVTHFADDHQLTTVNAFAHALLATTERETIIDPFAPELFEQWTAHRQAIRERRSDAIHPRDTDPVEFSNTIIARDLQSALAQGEIRPLPNSPYYVFRFVRAFKAAARLVGAASKVQRYRRALIQRGAPVVTLPLDVQLHLYRRTRAFQAKRSRRGVLAVIFALSGALTLFSFIPHSGGFAGAAILLAVVLFHELGHFAAMRLFGFKDTSIFFLPFFGGAASGTKEGASPAEEILVLFAGPAPGFILGIIIIFLDLGGLWQQAAIMLIAVNALNLLPIFPLDGGRIARTVLFSRTIVLDVIFQCAAAALSLVAAAYTDTWLLALPGFFTLVGLPRVVRTAKIARTVAREGSRDEEVLRALDRELPTAATCGERFGLAKLIEQKLASVPLTLGGSFAWGTVYAAVLAGAVTGSIFAVRGLSEKPTLIDIYRAVPGSEQSQQSGPCDDLRWLDHVRGEERRAVAVYTCKNARARANSLDMENTGAFLLEDDFSGGDYFGYVELPTPQDAKSAAREICRLGCDELVVRVKTLVEN